MVLYLRGREGRVDPDWAMPLGPEICGSFLGSSWPALLARSRMSLEDDEEEEGEG